MASYFAQRVSPIVVGREAELDLLSGALAAAGEGHGRCILLAGEAGMGKSRLLDEVRERALGRGFTVLQGNCFDQDASYPYSLWISALRNLLAWRSAAETAELLGAFAGECVKLLPELSLLLPEVKPTPALDPESEKRRLFEAVARLAMQLAAANPLLIALEDLHWSDETSLDLLHTLIQRVAGHPTLVLATFRSDEQPLHLDHFLSRVNHERMALEVRLAPLGRKQAAEMIRAILNLDHSPAAGFVDLTVRLTEGNPFFIEEVVKAVKDSGDLSETGTRGAAQVRKVAPGGELPVPASLLDLVRPRMERLGPGTRQVLSLAAVAGQRFSLLLLQEVSGQGEGELLDAIKELIAGRFVVEESADEFAFRHALTREAVYGRLLLRERIGMHQAIGAALERSSGARAGAAAAALAYHYYQGGVWEKALAYSLLAGEQAQALYAPHEALTHFTRALDSAQHLGLPAPQPALRGRARARALLDDFDGARADNEVALESARGRQDRGDSWQALFDLGFLWQGRDLARAGEYYRQALELAENIGDPAVLGQTLNRVGNWHMNLGRAREALPYHEQALALFRERDDLRGVAATLDLLGIVSYQLGEVVQGAAYLEQAVPIFRELDDRQGLVHALTNLAIRAVLETEVLGEVHFIQLTELSDEALQIARGFHWYQGEALALLQGAISLAKAGEYGRALEWLDRAQPLVRESGDRETLARFHLIYGETLTSLLALTEARQHLETGLAHLQQLGPGLLMQAAKGRLAWVALLENDLETARVLLDAVLPAGLPEGQELAVQRRCWIVRAELELAEGDPSAALEIVDRMLASTPDLTQYGPYAVPRLSRLRGKALSALGQPDEAENELRGALTVAWAQGLRPLVWRLYADLGHMYRAKGRREDAGREYASARATIQDLADRVPDGPLRGRFLKRALSALPDATAATPRQAAKREYGGLTAREREIAALIVQGKSNREIARALVISETTAERHVANILSKLQFNSRTQIAVWAADKGLGK